MRTHNILFSIGIISWCLLGLSSFAPNMKERGTVSDWTLIVLLLGIIMFFVLIGLVKLMIAIKANQSKPRFSEWKTARFCMNCQQQLTSHQVISCNGICPLCGHHNPHSDKLLDTFEQQFRVKTIGLQQTKEYKPLNSPQ